MGSVNWGNVGQAAAGALCSVVYGTVNTVHKAANGDGWGALASGAETICPIGIGQSANAVTNFARGDVAGGVTVSGFRPYVGVGFGRLVPKKRVAVRVELGTQIHGTPKVYADGKGDLDKVLKDAGDDDISKLIDKLTFYPVLKVTLRGRIF